MSRIPVLATLVVAAAVATMVALGVWQLHRADEKRALLAQYERAAALPPLDLDRWLAEEGRAPPLAFRRVRVGCRARDVEPEPRGGRSADGRGGTIYLLPCRPGEGGLAGRLRVDAGWSQLPLEEQRLTLDGPVAGTIGAVRARGPITLVAESAVPPLEPSAPPRLDQVPDNHLVYAFQWFFFAAAALLIYALALRRRLSRGARAPKSPLP